LNIYFSEYTTTLYFAYIATTVDKSGPWWAWRT